jgi:hypothetical protein
MDVFGTDHFAPWTAVGAIRDGRRPRHGENAFVLDREMQLQHLAPVVEVNVHEARCAGGSDIGVFFGVALQGAFGVLIICISRDLT